MSDRDLIIDLHVRNDRQGPGGDRETCRAIELARLSDAEPIAIADIGCGTGSSSLVLARRLNARVAAIDAAEPFIDRLRERTAFEGLSHCIEGAVGEMAALPFGDAQFDLLWSEGAIYNIGFPEGVRAWRQFLRPGGVLAISELSWTTASRPADVESHWTREYPGIRTASDNLRCLEQAGYQPLGFFFLPRECWEANYYAPLRSGFPAFLDRHGQSEAARRIVAAEEAEMVLYRERGEWYGYAFYIARKLDSVAAGES